jgi:hypothetical protein
VNHGAWVMTSRPTPIMEPSGIIAPAARSPGALTMPPAMNRGPREAALV